MNILPTGKRAKQAFEERVKEEEQIALEELSEFVEDFQERHDCVIAPVVILSASHKGMQSLQTKLEVLSNKRFKK